MLVQAQEIRCVKRDLSYRNSLQSCRYAGFGAVPSLLALLSVFLTGCTNACFVVVSNPPTGTIGVVAGNPPPACALPKANAAVRLVVHVNRLCEFCSESNRIQSVLLSLRGIDIRSRANAGGDSSEWQELLPQLERQPLQIDLPNESMNGRPADSFAERVPIPAGLYDVVRIRFAPNQPGAADADVPSRNACGGVGPNCLVMADGRIAPLVFEENTFEASFAPDTTADGVLLVLPGSESELLIELTPVSSIGASVGRVAPFFSLLPNRTRVVRLLPVE